MLPYPDHLISVNFTRSFFLLLNHYLVKIDQDVWFYSTFRLLNHDEGGNWSTRGTLSKSLRSTETQPTCNDRGCGRHD